MSDNLTPDQEDTLRELIGAYQVAKKAGKFIVALFIGMLGLIVLLSQAWDAVKHKVGG
jgi:H+/gluconate symporter-like permease